MTIADRIQALRKAKGVSQEELADRIGVSRQAVSKWESSHSTPDLDKIVLLSDYFSVSTDYILKGIEPLPAANRRTDAKVFVIVATVLNFIGVAVSAAVWYERQTAAGLAAGLVFLALGCMVFGVGLLDASAQTRRKCLYNFWSVNIWFLSFVPLSFFYNILFAGMAAPYPLPSSPFFAFPIFWVVYLTICIVVNLFLRRRLGT